MNTLERGLDDGHGTFSRTVIGLAAGVCVLLLGVFTGCAPAPEDSAQTVDYYRAHAKERQALVAKCVNDPGRLGNKPACINAQQAESIEGIGHFSDLPPMGLSEKKTAPSGGGAPPPK
jgi:hypothetical protein